MHWKTIDPLLLRAIEEDLGQGDLTTQALLPLARRRRLGARLLAREPLVLAGFAVFCRVFELLGECRVAPGFQDGEWVPPGEIAHLEGEAAVVLGAERVALNFLAHLSGIATLTRRFVEAVAGTGARILDTRKTTPGLRRLEKYAVRAGGGVNHRFGLDDAFLIKENHIRLAGSVAAAVSTCRRAAGHLQRVEVEVSDLKELEEALAAGAEVVLLDNMSPAQVEEAVRLNAGRAKLEVSGGVSLENVAEYARAGADLISVGALTHSAPAVDLSLESEPKE